MPFLFILKAKQGRHGGGVVSAVCLLTAKKVVGSIAISVWKSEWHVLAASAWLLSWFAGFLPLSQNMHLR